MNIVRRIRQIVVILLVSSVLLFARTGYILMRPGSAENLAGLVTVEGGAKEEEGRFYLVTVTQQNASPLLFLYALLSRNVDLAPSRQIIPPGMDEQRYTDLMRRWMDESQNLASVIAFRRKGLDVPIKSDGVEVVEVGEDSPAQGILAAGDIVLAVDGHSVALADELVRMVQLRRIGEPVTLRLLRAGREMTVSISTASHPERVEKAALRVLVQTLNWQPVLPLDVTIDAEEITGPSAGLMFVLEILDQLDPQKLTAGRLIAGTGTINLQEQIGAVGGVRQKVAAAAAAGAEFFLVPQGNYEEAVTAGQRVKIIPVSTLAEALDFLYSLNGGI